MTRNDIISFCQDERDEVDGTPGNLTPFAWGRLVSAAADFLARKTRCFYVEFTQDVAPGQSEYCAPPIDRILGARVTDASGNLISTRFGVPADGFRMAGWPDTPPQSGTPREIIALGSNLLRLVPAPDYATDLYDFTDLAVGTVLNTVTSALRPFTPADAGRFLLVTGGTGGTGFTPGRYSIQSVDGTGLAALSAPVALTASVGGTAGLSSGGLYVEGYGHPAGGWPNGTDECPLPEKLHMTVAWHACEARARRMKDYGAADRYRAEWERDKNQMVRDMMNYTNVHADRRPAYGLAGGWGWG